MGRVSRMTRKASTAAARTPIALMVNVADIEVVKARRAAWASPLSPCAISDDGEMLTQVRLEMVPGDKRLLNLTLPKDARFWFAFVNQSGVWPWREQDRILIPLEQQSRGGKAIPVEIFYSSRIGSAGDRALDLRLVAPKFDLPLENLTWRVCLSDKWRLKNWTGSLQLQQDEVVAVRRDG